MESFLLFLVDFSSGGLISAVFTFRAGPKAAGNALQYVYCLITAGMPVEQTQPEAEDLSREVINNVICARPHSESAAAASFM